MMLLPSAREKKSFEFLSLRQKLAGLSLLTLLLMVLSGFKPALRADVKLAEPPNYADEFGRVMIRAAIKLQEQAPKRFFKIKAMNDSLELTARAAYGINSGSDKLAVLIDLAEARRIYERNSFAWLLEAVVANAEGNTGHANRCYENFLLGSRTFSEFEESFLKWGEFHFLRRIVYEILKSRGVSFEGREQEVQVRIPYEKLILYGMKPGTWDMNANIFFLVLILGGAVGLVFLSLYGADFSGTIPGGLLSLYLAVWVAYGTWIFDLAFGLPGKLTRFWVVPLFLGTLVFLFGVTVARKFWEEHYQPVDEGFRRCPHCRGIIEVLLIECRYCRKLVE